MKKLIIAVIILMFAATAYGEPCTGVTEATVGNHDSFAFCWDPNAETDEVKQYNLMQDGILLDVIPVAACVVDRCDSPDYIERQRGVYAYTVVAVDVYDQVSEPSDPVTLTVIKVAPGQVKNMNKRQ